MPGAHSDLPRLLRALLDESDDALLALDEHGAIVEANAAAARLFGRVRTHLRGKPFVSLLPVAARRPIRRALNTLEPGASEAVDVELREDERPSRVSVRIPTASPQRVFIVRIADPHRARDVRTEAEAQTRVRLEHVFARFPHGVLGIRRDLRVAFANNGARLLLGRDACRAGERLTPARVPEPLHALAEQLARGRVPLRRSKVELADGRTLRVVGVPPLRDEPALLLLEDATAEHRAEHVLREFVRNAAHQLRTPLAAISAAVEVLQGGARDDPVALERFLGHIQDHVSRMTRLTRGLLVLARAQSGQQAPRLDFVELPPLLERLADAVPDVHVDTGCPPRLVALAEPDLVEEALMALVENAARHTLDGRIRVVAREETGRAVIEVADNGPGILPEHRGRILEPFVRLDASGEGVGLGLAIAAQAVRAMDGDLSVDGVVGGGTTFRMRLPSARIAR